jgi:hypothetical protein
VSSCPAFALPQKLRHEARAQVKLRENRQYVFVSPSVFSVKTEFGRSIAAIGDAKWLKGKICLIKLAYCR